MTGIKNGELLSFLKAILKWLNSYTDNEPFEMASILHLEFSNSLFLYPQLVCHLVFKVIRTFQNILLSIVIESSIELLSLSQCKVERIANIKERNKLSLNVPILKQ